MQITLFERTNAVLCLTQVKEQLLLRRGRPQFHKAPRAQDVFLNRRTNPPHGVGRQTEAFFRVKPFDRLHQTDVRFRDHFCLRQAITTVAHRDFRREAQVRGHKFMCRTAVFVIHPPFGEHIFFFRLQHRKTPNFLHIAV